LNFAARRLRQFGYEVHAARVRVCGEAVLDVLLEIGSESGRRLDARPQNHERFDDFTA
jgi:hypothetical protein